MFKGCCANRDMSHLSIKDRYNQIAWTDAWGDFGAKSIFDVIDNLEPGMELDYQTWQKLMYANKLLAKHYNWFEDLHGHVDKGIFPEWDNETEEYNYTHMYRNPKSGNMKKTFIKGSYLKEYLKNLNKQ